MVNFFSLLRGGKERAVRIVKPPQQHCGDEIKMANPSAMRVDFTSNYTENHDPTRGEEMLRRHVSEKQKTKPRKVFSFNLNMCQIFVSCDVNKYC